MWEWNKGSDFTSSQDRLPEADKRPEERYNLVLCVWNGFRLLRTLAELAKVGEVGVSKLVWCEREKS